MVALTPTRLIAALQKSEEEAPPWTPDEAMVRQKFNHYDTNNSGNLDENEVMAGDENISVQRAEGGSGSIGGIKKRGHRGRSKEAKAERRKRIDKYGGKSP